MWLNFHREVSLTLFRFFSGFPLEYLDPSYRLCCNLPWVVTPKIELNTKQTVVKTEHFTAVFLYPFLGRTWLNGKQKPHQSGVILSQRWWAVHSHYQIQSIRHENHVAFLRKAYTWADMDNYNYHKGMKGIIQELKCLLKTKSISLLDQFNLLHINDSIP